MFICLLACLLACLLVDFWKMGRGERDGKVGWANDYMCICVYIYIYVAQR